MQNEIPAVRHGKSPKRRRLLAPALAIALAVGLAACGTSGDPGSSGSDHSVLTIASWDNLRGNYDPQQSQSGMNQYMTPVFETLVDQDASGTILPMLATAWEVNDEGTFLKLTLREGVTFHNGEPFDAEAVKASIERGQTLETSAVKGALSPITSIEVNGEYEITLDVPGGGAERLLGVLAGVAGVVVPPEASDDPEFATHPIGTGPWMVSDDSDATANMIYLAYPEYWDPSVQGVDEIVVKVLSEQASKNGLLDGSVDFIEVREIATAEAAEAAGMVNLDTSGIMTVFLYQFNKQPGKLFDNENLRLALAYAIDRESLVDNVFSQVSQQRCEVTSQPVPAGSPYYNSDLEPITFDPEKAKELMAAGGKPDGFTFTVTASSAYPPFELALTAMQQQLSEVGIQMDITVQPLTSLNEEWLAGKYDALFQAAITPTVYTGPANLGTVDDDDPSVSELWNSANTAPTVEAQTADLQAWSAAFQETAYSATICNMPQNTWVQPNVKGLSYKPPFAHWILYKNVTIED